MPIQVQVAFQGGGAKLVPLLAVAHAFQDAEREQVIEIKRLAGTSAGAIAASLLATRKDLQLVWNHLEQNGRQIVDMISPGDISLLHPTTLFRLLTGRPLVDDGRIFNAIRELFSVLGKNRNGRPFVELGDLDIPLRITATDLLSEKMKIFDDSGENIAHALLHSCGLPFVIKSVRNLGDPAYVDGGICENFPSDALANAPELGSVLGVSFHKKDAKHRLTGIMSFAASLMNAAINNSVDRARSTLEDERVFLIDTHLETFDFDQAVKAETLRDHYGHVRTLALQWIRDTVRALENPESVVFIKPVEDIRPEREMQANLFEVFKAHHEQARYKLRRVALTVTAYSLCSQDEPESKLPDVVTQEIEFTVTDEPLYCVCFKIDGGSESAAEGTAQFELFDQEGQSHEVIAIPVLDMADARQPNRHVVIYFKNPLCVEDPPKTYTVKQRDRVRDCMAPLSRTGSDFLSLVRGNPMAAEKADLVLFVPKKFPELLLLPRMKTKGGRKALLGQQMTDRELAPYKAQCPIGFRPIGWTGVGLAHDNQLGVDISLKNPS